ncbi:MAG TPA: zf-HC2 domain-containing protein [Candidatus Polarisedimenticolaceae bacterium]|nr:zf-HC2 domain-containing protein [Candidatus Polarisedimenticolaceae bacterium]
MRCSEFVDFLDRYVERRLDASESEEFDRHLRVCPDCVRFLENYRQTIELVRVASRDDDRIPAEVPRELIAAVRAAIRRRE